VPSHPGSGPGCVWTEIIGGDALGRGNEPAVCWWLPPGSSVQHAYRLRTDDGFDTGRVDSRTQAYVRLPVFDRSRRSTAAQVKVWTDLGESEWSAPVPLEADLLKEEDWSARWIGVEEGTRPGKGAKGAKGVHGSRPTYWLRTPVEVPPFGRARLYVTALGLYEAFLDGRRVGDVELAPGYTQYRARVQYQAYDVTSLVRPGRHVLAVLLADGWYRGQVGLPRAADQYGDDMALRAQFEVQTEQGWQVVAATFLHRHVAGLRPTEPGYRTFEVRPRPGGGITDAMTRHVSPFGPIEASWRLGDGSTDLDVLVPPGTMATVVLPGEAPHQVRPGRHHWTGAAPAA
jgi:hypothetical protein